MRNWTDEQLTVRYQDHSVTLNRFLIKKRNISNISVWKIMVLHRQQLEIEVAMEKMPVTAVNLLQSLMDEITEINFELQDLWGFQRNADFHKTHYLPHCTCPKIDNDVMVGTPQRYIAEGCPLHDRGQIQRFRDEQEKEKELAQNKLTPYGELMELAQYVVVQKLLKSETENKVLRSQIAQYQRTLKALQSTMNTIDLED